jgi:ribosomal protein S18 acetylase RimI-like enzyme
MQADNGSADKGSHVAGPVVSALNEKDLPEAERIFRVAFGTFLGAPDPELFWADRDYVYGRQRAPHVASFGATLNGKIVGSNFATKWGSVGFFGPITVRPDLQERGIAQALLAKTMEQFDAWGTRHVGLFTFAQSAKHVGLYQKYGFYARFLTAIMSSPVAPRQSTAGWSRFGELNVAQQNEALLSCQDIADTLCPGLDLTEEIRATHAQGLGDTVLLEGPSGIAAFAVCHYGPRSEAGAGACFIKFAAVRAGASAEQDYLRLLDACETLALAVRMRSLLAGANMARHEAYRHLVARGFRTEIQGVTMHRHNDPGYCRSGVYIIDDWR